MKSALRLCPTVLGIAVGLCAPASATIVDATFTGTVGGGSIDIQGLFGPAGASLAGDTFVLTFEYDTTKGAYSRSKRK
jgi:hypothetical protein